VYHVCQKKNIIEIRKFFLLLYFIKKQEFRIPISKQKVKIASLKGRIPYKMKDGNIVIKNSLLLKLKSPHKSLNKLSK